MHVKTPYKPCQDEEEKYFLSFLCHFDREGLHLQCCWLLTNFQELCIKMILISSNRLNLVKFGERQVLLMYPSMIEKACLALTLSGLVM